MWNKVKSDKSDLSWNLDEIFDHYMRAKKILDHCVKSVKFNLRFFSDFTWKQFQRFLLLRNCHFGNFQGTEFLFWWLIAIFHHRKYLISEPQKMSKWQFLMSRTIKLISRKNLNCKKSENFHNLCGKTRNSFTRKNISINQFFSVVSIENTRCFHEIFDIRVNFRN